MRSCVVFPLSSNIGTTSRYKCETLGRDTQKCKRFIVSSSTPPPSNIKIKNGQNDGNDRYLKQILELEQEKANIFQSDLDNGELDGQPKPPSNTNVNNVQNEGNDLFLKQMLELEHKRTNLFQSDLGIGELDGQKDDASRGEIEYPPRPTANDLLDMNEDRDSLYAFSEEEVSAWGKVKSSSTTDKKIRFHSHKPEFMDVVLASRKAKKLREEQQEEMMKHNIVVSGSPGDNNTLGQPNESSLNNIDSRQNNEVFTHLSERGDSVSMVDVGFKNVTRRSARARSVVVFPPEVMEALGLKDEGETVKNNFSEVIGPKGPIVATARIAGIMGAKQTSTLIPLCHPLPLEKVHIDISLRGNKAIVECECHVTHKTGVEMEALVGASIAVLTIYDMLKAVSHNVRIVETELISKTGGKKDYDIGDRNGS